MEPIKFKAMISVIILVAGAFLVALVGTGMNATAYQATGVAVDFGDRDVTWTDVDLNAHSDPMNALDFVCDSNNYTYTVLDGKVVEINGIQANDEYTWDLWVVNNGDTQWTKLNSYDVDLRNYSANVWAYCNGSEVPTVGVDQSGRSIYGYAQASRTVSLSPAITEIVGSLNAVTTLVGTDRYSDYPSSVIEGQQRGDITVVGDFVSPSYELIMSTHPDIVFCDGSQYTQYEMSQKLQKSNVNAIVLYSGESIDTILDNIYIVGVAIGYGLRGQSVISSLESAQQEIITHLQSNDTKIENVMLSLSPDKSPWVSGKYTYANDISECAFGFNVMSSNMHGWVNINSAMIATANPSTIIIISSEYAATQAEYDSMLASLSGEWKYTDAYKNGQIYLMCDGLSVMASHAGPRYAQLMELMAMIMHPDAFEMHLPKYIGNDYRDYLTFTKYLGFEGGN